LLLEQTAPECGPDGERLSLSPTEITQEPICQSLFASGGTYDAALLAPSTEYSLPLTDFSVHVYNNNTESTL